MIYQFPDVDTFRLAITSSVVPTEVSLAPAVGAIDDDGRVWLQPSETLPKKSLTALRKLGVETYEANGDLKAKEVCCWLQLLPLERDPAPPALSAQAPVLFELPDTSQLPSLVSEMLRLGNDRQSFRWLKDGKKERALLRVIGPPYYSLLRALEKTDSQPTPRAYTERTPGVWIEIGHNHPLIQHFKAPAGKVMLLRPPQDWDFLDEGPFRDIYEILDFKLPEAKAGWKAIEPGARFQVPLRLTPCGGSEIAELWVFREDAFQKIDDFVRGAEDTLLDRLSFAVGEAAGQKRIVLRVRPSKHAPPVLVLPDAVSFRPFLKLPNLFMPAGWALKPPLRRDAVRQLLADDPDQLVWLYPGADGAFTPESLPDAAFRSLRDWVEYVLDRDRATLQAWIEAARFDFNAFICKDDVESSPKPPRGKAPRGEKRSSLLAEGLEADDEPPPAPVAEKGKRKVVREEDEYAALADAKPNELQEQLIELKKEFETIQGPLDDPARKALWPKMAPLHAALNESADAAICWLNAMWDHETPPPEWVWPWARTEAGLPTRTIAVPELDKILALADPQVHDFRALVACILQATWSDPDAAPTSHGPPRKLTKAQQALIDRLPKIQAFLEHYEPRIGTRAVWLAWSSLARLSAGDVLSLAKTRDRLLDRLLNHGLSLEFDLPSFLRFSGQQGSERYVVVRDRVVGLQKLAHQWIEECYEKGDGTTVAGGNDPSFTQAYKDMVFSFGVARLGETTECHRLKQRATQKLTSADQVHSLLARMYSYRIEETLAGRPHVGSLPEADLQVLQNWSDESKKNPKDNKYRVQTYIVNRLRDVSNILEPHEKIDPYRDWRGTTDDVAKQFEGLYAISDQGSLENSISKLLRAEKKPSELLRIMGSALVLGPRLSEDFIVKIIARVVAMKDAVTTVQDRHELEHRTRLLERGLFLAGHYDRIELVHPMIGSVVQLLESQKGETAAEELERVAGQSLRCLRKLGLRQEIETLLHKMSDLVMQGKPLEAVREQFKISNQWVHVLQTLLHIASGWLYFGRLEIATPIMDEARHLLFEAQPKPITVYRTKLACTYATTLGQAPVDFALKRFEELFKRLGPLCDSFTSSSHFSVSQLRVVEAVVLAVVSDDFAVGQDVRRWLDEDEYLVRSRIHRDLRALMAQSGV